MTVTEFRYDLNITAIGASSVAGNIRYVVIVLSDEEQWKIRRLGMSVITLTKCGKLCCIYSDQSEVSRVLVSKFCNKVITRPNANFISPWLILIVFCHNMVVSRPGVLHRAYKLIGVRLLRAEL